MIPGLRQLPPFFNWTEISASRLNSGFSYEKSCQIFGKISLYVLCVVVFYGIIDIMKLWYDRKSKDPTYFVQLGVRNGKKTTTKNVARIGKHSELLKITDDPLAYAKEQVRLFNEEAEKNKTLPLELRINFAEKIKATDAVASSSTRLNIGYLFLQQLYHELELGSFFKEIAADSKLTFDPNLVNRFLTFSRILDPDSKLATHQHLGNYYEQPEFEYVHIRVFDSCSLFLIEQKSLQAA